MRTDYLRNGIIMFVIFLIFAWITLDWGLEFGFADLVLLLVSLYYIIAGLAKSEPKVAQKWQTSPSTAPPIQTQTSTPTVNAPPSPPQRPQPPTPKCSTCGQPLMFVEQYKRWYCQNERKYISPNTQASPTIPTAFPQTMPPPAPPSIQQLDRNTTSRPESPIVTRKPTQADKLPEEKEENTRLLENLKKKADEGEISEESYNKLRKELTSKEETENEKQELQQELDMLDKRLIEGRISEATYRELKEKFQSKLNRL